MKELAIALLACGLVLTLQGLVGILSHILGDFLTETGILLITGVIVILIASVTTAEKE